MTSPVNTPPAAEPQAADQAAETEARPGSASGISVPAAEEAEFAPFGMPSFAPFDAPFGAPADAPAEAAQEISEPAPFGMPPFAPFDAPFDAPAATQAEAAEPEVQDTQNTSAPEPVAEQEKAEPAPEPEAIPVATAPEPETEAESESEPEAEAETEAAAPAPEAPAPEAEPLASEAGPEAAPEDAEPEPVAETEAAPEDAEPSVEEAARPAAEDAEPAPEPVAGQETAAPAPEPEAQPEARATQEISEPEALAATKAAATGPVAEAAAPVAKAAAAAVAAVAVAAVARQAEKPAPATAPAAQDKAPEAAKTPEAPKLRALASRATLPGNRLQRQRAQEEPVPAPVEELPPAPQEPAPPQRLDARLKAAVAQAYQRSGGMARWVRSMAFWVIAVPVVLSALVCGFWADDMYVSEAQMTVHTSKGLSSGDSGGSRSLGASAMTLNTDIFLVYEYIRSTDLMRQLESEAGLRAHYADRRHDVFTRMKKGATDEEMLEYYQAVVSVSVDSSTGILKVRVRSYDPAYSHRLAQKVIKHSEDLINKVNERAVTDAMSLAQDVLDRAERRLVQAQGKVKEFRLKYGDFSPSTAASNTMTLLSSLEEQQAKASAELTMLRSYMREDSPQVISLKSRVDAIARQLAAEQQRLTGSAAAGKASLVVEYDALMQERDFAARALDGARDAMDQARINALSKTRYLEAFVQPNLPEEATYPERLMCIGVTAIFAFLAWGIIGLTWAAIKEHTGF